MKKKFFKRINNNKGFTLIEILIVLAIMGVIMQLVAVSTKPRLAQAKCVSISKEIEQLRKAVSLYYRYYKTVPANMDDLISKGFFNTVKKKNFYDYDYVISDFNVNLIELTTIVPKTEDIHKCLTFFIPSSDFVLDNVTGNYIIRTYIIKQKLSKSGISDWTIYENKFLYNL